MREHADGAIGVGEVGRGMCGADGHRHDEKRGERSGDEAVKTRHHASASPLPSCDRRVNDGTRALACAPPLGYPLPSVRRLRLLAVGLLLLGLLVSTTGIGHAHVGSSNDACAVCVHARSVAVAPQAVTTIDPIVLATLAPTRSLESVVIDRVAPTRGRAPPFSTSSSR